jgi:Ferritin-like domain
VPILNGLLGVEFFAAYAYTAAIPLLVGRDMRAARQFLHQELAHITVVRTLIESVHGEASVQRASYPLGHPHGRSGLLAMLHRVEAESIRAYVEAIPKLSAGGVRAAAASVMANEGQHISVLRASLGLQPVPAALVTGSE